jgi:membrane-associated phospholipid phosphatase
MASKESGMLQDVAGDALAPGTALAPGRRIRERAATGLRSLRKLLLRVAGVAMTCAVLVAVSAALIDRPVATWVHGHLGDDQFAWFTTTHDGYMLRLGPFNLMAGPAEALQPLAALVLAALALAASAGWRPGIRGRIALALCLSVFVAIVIDGIVKVVFGRTWPGSWQGDNPSWIRDGVFGFSPFHGGPGWGSFPSGHTARITPPPTILWLVWPELRAVWATLVAIVVAGLIGANYHSHFVSDIIGGLYLGVAGLMLTPNDRIVTTGRPC